MLGVPVAGSHSEMMPAHSEAALRLIKPRATKTNAATACKFNVTPTPTVAYAATQGSGWLEGDFTRVAFSGASAELQLRPNTSDVPAPRVLEMSLPLPSGRSLRLPCALAAGRCAPFVLEFMTRIKGSASTSKD